MVADGGRWWQMVGARRACVYTCVNGARSGEKEKKMCKDSYTYIVRSLAEVVVAFSCHLLSTVSITCSLTKLDSNGCACTSSATIATARKTWLQSGGALGQDGD